MPYSKVEGREYPKHWPQKCEHCGSENLHFNGLVAPGCDDCGRATLSHMMIVKHVVHEDGVEYFELGERGA